MTLDAIARSTAHSRRLMSSGGKYSADLAQLVAGDKILGNELTVPLTVDLNVSDDGMAYLARVSSDIVSVAWNRSGSTSSAAVAS